MNRFIRRLAVPVLALSVVAGSVFGGAVAFADPPAQGGAHHGRHHGARAGGDGDEAMIDFSLNHLNLNGPQRSQIEAVKSGLTPAREQVKNARKDLMEALAPEISSNTVDSNVLQPKIDALGAAVRNERAAEDAAVDQLHSILDTSQRAELANMLEARMTQREQAHAQHQAQRQQQGNNGHANNAQRAGHGGQREGGLARALSLTPAQEQQVKSIMQSERSSSPRPDFAAMKAQRTAMLEAFKGQSFSASSFHSVDAGARAKEGATRFVDAAGKITQILTAEQRATAAQKMQAAAARGRMAI
jgi:Spy/CpxP family protein refolding chaperone